MNIAMEYSPEPRRAKFIDYGDNISQAFVRAGEVLFNPPMMEKSPHEADRQRWTLWGASFLADMDSADRGFLQFLSAAAGAYAD